MKLPEYDPACGLTPFEWIIQAAEQERERRRAEKHELFSSEDRRKMKWADADIEQQDARRLLQLRKKYDQNRRATPHKVATQRGPSAGLSHGCDLIERRCGNRVSYP